MTDRPRVRSLPARSVLVELPGTAEAVEAAVTALPDPAPLAAWRRLGWLVAFVPTIALLVFQNLAGRQGWAVPDAVVLLAMLGLVLTAVLALVRYQDDRAKVAFDRGARALLDDPVRAIGTFSPRSEPDADEPAGGSTTGVLTLTPASGVPLARPVRVVVPPGTAGPRAGDPLAVWHAGADDDATQVLLVRYHRGWADDLLTALPPADLD